MADRQPGDLLGGQTPGGGDVNGTLHLDPEDSATLKSIDATLRDMLQNGRSMSQSDARNYSGTSNRWQPNRSRTEGRGGVRTRSGRSIGDLNNVKDEFISGFRDSLMESVLGPDFKNKISDVMTEFANTMGVNIQDIPKKFGQELGKKFLDSKTGKQFQDKASDLKDRALNKGKDAFMDGIKKYQSGSDSGTDFVNMFGKIFKSGGQASAEGVEFGSAAEGAMSGVTAAEGAEAAAGAVEVGGAVAAGGEAMTAAMAGFAEVAATAIPPLLAVVAALYVFDKLLEQFTPLIEGFKKMWEAASKAANRYEESRKKNLELEKERMRQDVESYIRKPFEILEAAAQELYNSWDNNVRKINATQGYTKDDLYNLYSIYANKLRQEGLASVIPASDIISNLSKVIDSGLSGEAAANFAYLATKLNAAIPTQDFFNYASSYAAIAANLIKEGKSQEEATSAANSQLEAFASNVLYANRQLSGGFTTGLSNASDLFESAFKITQAARIGDSTQIGGVLTAVSSIIGSIAPDLTNDIVSAVVSAAVGGNSSEWVALRSLAGINASNTEFLQQLANDPQSVFANLFRNLSSMQSMSEGNYMEVAEGLSSVFGISFDALSRVDFGYLADAVTSMNVNNNSLDENLKLLSQGETTTNEELLKMRQINEYMVNEGLAYVMDNETARAIQQHMWDEQIARELQEATYAVELKGGALEFLEGIKQTVDNIINFLNPFGWLKKAANLVATIEEANTMDAELKQMLELGKVGQGTSKELYNLTTRNADLHLTRQLVELMGGYSRYGALNSSIKGFNAITNPSGAMDAFGIGGTVKKAMSAGMQNAISNMLHSGVGSAYAWGTVSKTASNAFFKSSMGKTSDAVQLRSSKSKLSSAKDRAQQNFEKFINEDLDKYIQENASKGTASYEDWKKRSTKFGIKDLGAAMDQYGVTEQQLKGRFNESETQEAAKAKHDREEREEYFWEENNKYVHNEQEKWIEWEELVNEKQDIQIQWLTGIYNELHDVTDNKFLNHIDVITNWWHNDWTRYIRDHIQYTIDTGTGVVFNTESGQRTRMYSDLKQKRKDEDSKKQKEQGKKVIELMNNLVNNNNNLLDPTVQTNTLLAAILKVLEAIMQQNNTAGELNLPTALQALGLGSIDGLK